jgi:hypothetical protein
MDKGKIMSQTFFERQSKLFDLYQVSFARGEMSADEAMISLRMIGFSDTIATIRVREWAAPSTTGDIETDRAKKQRLKQMASLEKYILQMRLGKKFYLRLKFKRNELSKDETVKKLTNKGYTVEIAKEMVNQWETER